MISNPNCLKQIIEPLFRVQVTHSGDNSQKQIQIIEIKLTIHKLHTSNSGNIVFFPFPVFFFIIALFF